MPTILYLSAVILLVVNLLTSDSRIYLNPTSRNELVREKDKIELVCEDGSTALLVPDWEADTTYQYVCPYKKPKGGLYYMTIMMFGFAIISDFCKKCRKGISKKAFHIIYTIEKIGEMSYNNKVYIQLVGAIILIVWQYTTWW